MIKGDEKKNPEIKEFKLKELKKLEELESHFIITSDMGRPYEPMDSVRMYIIEHCVRFLEVYSSLLFNKDVVGFDPLDQQDLAASRLHHRGSKCINQISYATYPINILDELNS